MKSKDIEQIIDQTRVAPLAGAWIEMMGKKKKQRAREEVAPLAGAWIEMTIIDRVTIPVIVAPLAGAWIEISTTATPLSERWVAPLAGAWIEI